VNHGLSASVLEGAMAVSKEFFAMPENEKQTKIMKEEGYNITNQHCTHSV
jgi:isopenicillin N synthase-like dioxygenase